MKLSLGTTKIDGFLVLCLDNSTVLVEFELGCQLSCLQCPSFDELQIFLLVENCFLAIGV